MKWICLLALFFVSCGSDPVARPFAAQPMETDDDIEHAIPSSQDES